MQSSVKVLVGLGAVAAIVAVGLGIGWLGSRGPSAPPPQTAPSPSASPGERDPVPTPVRSANTVPAVQPGPGAPVRTDLAPLTDAATVTATNASNWEDKLDEILGSDDEDTNKVTQLFAMFPQLPEDGQLEVAEHLANLTDDEGYAPLGQLLQNPQLPEPVLDALLADVLNRPNAVKLPAFLEIAKNLEHPKAGEAKELLELYLDEDYGTDWARWQEELQKWLKENPD